MPRLRRVAGLCSSNVSDTANMLRKIRKKKSSAVPLFSKRSHVGNLRQTLQGKGEIHKRVETVGVYPLVRPRGVSALPRRGARHVPAAVAANPPAEVQRKTLRPSGTNTLTQFAHPAQPVQRKRCRPERGEPAHAVCVPRLITVNRCKKTSVRTIRRFFLCLILSAG